MSAHDYYGGMLAKGDVVQVDFSMRRYVDLVNERCDSARESAEGIQSMLDEIQRRIAEVAVTGMADPQIASFASRIVLACSIVTSEMRDVVDA
jgi:hypothetical protein